MIKVSSGGDMFKIETDILVCPVNTIGVMGGGLAKRFKDDFPGLEHAYKIACKSGRLVVGKIFKFTTINEDIICFPTKIDWRDPSKLEFIQDTLPEFYRYLNERSRTRKVIGHPELKINIPALGCGLGNLDFNDVFPLLKKSLQNIPHFSAIIFKPK